MIKNIAAILVVFAIGFGVWYAAPRAFPELGDTPFFMTVLNPTKISQEVSAGDAVLLDVRTAEEITEDGYAAGSTHFDIVRMREGELPDIAKDTRIYTYCRAGGRAAEAEALLKEAGWERVRNIGGLADWEAAGGEVLGR